MSSESETPESPEGKRHPLRKVVWLFVALMPSAVALYSKTDSDLAGLLRRLIIINAAFSLVAAVGLVWGIMEPVGGFFLAFFLCCFFFILNVTVVVAVACAPMLH